MKILAVSDVELGFIYSPGILDRFGDVDLVVSCGDLPYYYLEYIISMLNKPLYYVRGNHANTVEHSESGTRSAPWGAINLHRRVRREGDLLLAGLQGSLRYNNGPYQYSQSEMWWLALTLAPRLLWNRARFGRALDILVSHAPPWHIHDQEDLPHRGFKAFRWLLSVFQPRYHLHGHIHVYRPDTLTETRFRQTQVINVYGYKLIQPEQ